MAFPSPRAAFPDEVEVPTLPVPRKRAAVVEEQLAERLWALPETAALLEAAKESAFIKGIRCNTLDPQNYGIYLLQDCAYLASARDNFALIQHNPCNPPELKEYYAAKVTSYTAYAAKTYQSWHISDQVYGAVRLSPAARDYITFETSVLSDYRDRPIYYALANYPCFRLWPEMCKYLSTSLGSQTKTVYQKWIDDNKDFSSANKLATLLNKYSGNVDWESAKRVFLTALEYEVKFFNSFETKF